MYCLYFLAVVREESITKASEMLHITQATLSRQLSQMEEEIGVKMQRNFYSHLWDLSWGAERSCIHVRQH